VNVLLNELYDVNARDVERPSRDKPKVGCGYPRESSLTSTDSWRIFRYVVTNGRVREFFFCSPYIIGECKVILLSCCEFHHQCSKE
jgi:hypothetical protein